MSVAARIGWEATICHVRYFWRRWRLAMTRLMTIPTRAMATPMIVPPHASQTLVASRTDRTVLYSHPEALEALTLAAWPTSPSS